jgi:biopolymer transport protein ExbD
MNSLLDVLVILLVFLIKNYTASEVELAIPKGILIPISSSQSYVHKGITIQISKEFEVYIENKLVTKLNDSNWEDKDKLSIKNELISLRDSIEQIAFESDEGVSFSGIVNLIMDRSVLFEHIEKIMDVSTEIGFEQFKFIVIES